MIIHSTPWPRAFSLATAFLLAAVALGAWGEADVALERTPDGGIQPQVAVDAEHTLHLIYYKGDPKAGDLYYVRKNSSADAFSNPIRVNSIPGAAVAAGTIRGGQLALGKNGRVHVIWNGSAEARSEAGELQLFYTHLDPDGGAFLPERNIITFAYGLDGGASVTADGAGNVYVAWHARGANQPRPQLRLPEVQEGARHERPAAHGESQRRVYLARSTDGGLTFSPETAIDSEQRGVCPCCQLKVFAKDDGSVFVAYRIAQELVHRDTVLLVSQDHGTSFKSVPVQPWEIGACPMSGYAFVGTEAGAVLAWETAEQVYHAAVGSGIASAPDAVAAPGKGPRRKHPAIVRNRNGEMLMAWSEGTSFGKGGTLHWQRYDAAGHPVGELGRAEGVPVWGLPAVYADEEGGFHVVY